PAGIGAGRAAGWKRAPPHEPGPADAKELTAASGQSARYNVGGPLEYLVGIEPRRIDRHGVGSGQQRRDPTPAVARVAFLHVQQDVAVYGRAPAPPQLPEPATGARLRARGDEELDDGVGTDRGANVATVEHGARRAARRVRGEIALHREERGADAGDRGD